MNNIMANNSQRIIRILLLVSLFFVQIKVSLGQSDNSENSENFSQESAVAKTQQFMVVTSDRRASAAAYKILDDGGSAADAAIAAQLVLGLTEPHASGLGGGAFVLYYDKNKKKLITLDARETAPQSADENLFRDSTGQIMDFSIARSSGKSVGIPGTPALLGKLHNEYGKLSMAELIRPARELALNGFVLSNDLKRSISRNKKNLMNSDYTNDYFLDTNFIKNPHYAESLDSLAKHGYESFYRNPMSTNIILTVNANGGDIKQNDFDSYKVIRRDPVCDDFFEYKVCSMGEPSSGAITMLQILKIFEYSPTWHTYIEASKLAFADRNYYIADSDFVDTPGRKLLADEYIKNRYQQIGNEILHNPSHGLVGMRYQNNTNGLGPEERGTTHISIVDMEGNILSMTSTIESSFGSKLMSNGYLLNNELTDFSFLAYDKNRSVANRVQAGKRPRSSMTPTIVFKKSDGSPVLVLGSAGGSRIIGHVTQRLIDVLYYKSTLKDAIYAAHLLSQGNVIESESITNVTRSLERKGHKIEVKNLLSALNGIHFDDSNVIVGVSDPRREGLAIGR